MMRYEAQIAVEQLKSVSVGSKAVMLGQGDFLVELDSGKRVFYSLRTVREFIRQGFFEEDEK